MPLCHLLRSSSFTLSGAGQSIGSDEDLTFCSKDAYETSSVRKTRENTQSWNICHEQELTLVVQNSLEHPLISCCYLIFNLCIYRAKSFAYKCGRSLILCRTKLREKIDTDNATCGHWYSLIPVQWSQYPVNTVRIYSFLSILQKGQKWCAWNLDPNALQNTKGI